MRVGLIALMVLVVGGCSAPPPTDPALLADLRVAVVTTLDAMAVPADQRPSDRALEREVGVLAIQAPPERIERIRAGQVRAVDLQAVARDLIQHVRTTLPDAQPPALLVQLTDMPPQALTLEQILLLEALIRQTEQETGKRDRRRRR